MAEILPSCYTTNGTGDYPWDRNMAGAKKRSSRTGFRVLGTFPVPREINQRKHHSYSGNGDANPSQGHRSLPEGKDENCKS
ncbi:hypothetical protein [Corynebacterium resistens]|uniref:hypothetical protein n=1 Tax=Corynebacterium resistens TaxID=258224 RepID=UPI002355219B|nr:hypothetical protein [Corynebacterium resistens]